MNKHFLLPSCLFVTNNQYEITTILGSCVSVCLYDSENKIAGINHYLLPVWDGNGLATLKFGNISTKKLVFEMEKKGALRKNLVAKVFGGMTRKNCVFNIGDKNAEIAIRTLKELNIKIEVIQVGGTLGRRILFNTNTGKVHMKMISQEENNTVCHV